jgi:hypothetical protein
MKRVRSIVHINIKAEENESVVLTSCYRDATRIAFEANIREYKANIHLVRASDTYLFAGFAELANSYSIFMSHVGFFLS